MCIKQLKNKIDMDKNILIVGRKMDKKQEK